MSHRSPTSAVDHRDSGFALIAGLLLLLVMSLIGVSMMNVTRLETMMAGAARESNISLQAAEAALREAELAVSAAVVPTSSQTGWLLGEDSAEPDFFSTSTWSSSSTVSSAITNNYPELTLQPRYVAKHVGFVQDESGASSLEIDPAYQEPPGSDAFRITARAVSRDGTSETILQSYYAKPN